MWLFLATEVLFFGALFFIYAVYRSAHPAGTAEASRHAELAIGTINTVLLLTSSAVLLSTGLGVRARGRDRASSGPSVATAALGTAFLLLKGYEWMEDFRTRTCSPVPASASPGRHAVPRNCSGASTSCATGLHGVHLVIGIGLVGWIAWSARRGRYSPGTPPRSKRWACIGVSWTWSGSCCFRRSISPAGSAR